MGRDIDQQESRKVRGESRDLRQRAAICGSLDWRIGLAHAADADWAGFAEALRAVQLAELRHNALRVIERAALPANAPLVAAGCGDFLVRRLAEALGRPCLDFADLALAGAAAEPTLARWAQVAAPSVAVALLRARAPAHADAVAPPRKT